MRRGESVKYLISDDVIGYIRQHNLYQVCMCKIDTNKSEINFVC